MSNGTTTWTYTYNANGMRTKRTDGTKTYQYVYDGSVLTYMNVDGKILRFAHSPDGAPMSVLYESATYLYVTNLQGDVVAILDQSGNVVVEYTYDAWGNIISIDGSMKDTLGKANPLRYRGYVYDQESGLYYLQSRYYNPQTGRFLNADGLISTGQGLLGNNMFAYCGNNPVNRADKTGGFWQIVVAAILCITVLSGCSMGVGGATAPAEAPPDYIQNNDPEINCYGYAFGLDNNTSPGSYSITEEDPSHMFENSQVHTAEEITSFVLRDMNALGKTVRVVNSPSDKSSNEYIVAMRTSDIINPNIGLADYHFAVLLSDGTWADKMGWTASRWNVVGDPAFAWDSDYQKGYYNVGPVYFAVTR